MKGLLKFKNETEYNSAKIECTNVSYLVDEDSLKLKQYVEKTYYPLNVTYDTYGASKVGFYTSYDSSFISNFPYMSINGGEKIETSEQYYNDGDNVTFYSTTPITNIDFFDNQNISYISVPSSVTSIDEEAFKGCTNLTSVTFEEGSQLTTIGKNAFSGCSSLSSIEIPSNVTSIGYDAFGYCSNLSSITFEEGSQCTSIGGYAFYVCSSLSSIEIPSSVTSIGYDAFSHCSNLSSITFEEGSQLQSIGNYAFYNCDSLSSITIPNNVTSIGEKAFNGCTSLSSIEIASSVTTIGNLAFDYCTSLTSITFEDGSQLQSIGTSAFTHCTSLSSITIPNSVTSISISAFGYCTSLTSVTFEEGSQLQSIGDYAFYNCDSLSSITIPNNVTTIGHGVFNSCDSLNEIISYPMTAPSTDGYSFYLGCFAQTNGKLFIPQGASGYDVILNQINNEDKCHKSWTIETLYEPQECTNLIITAEDVNGIQTTTTISYTATTNGINIITNEPMVNIEVTGTAISNSFEQNTDKANTVVRTITFEYMGVTAETTITQGVWVDQSYSINLNDQWQLSSTYANFDSATYDGIYESFSNYNVNSSSATCIVTINGYTNFTLYIGSYGESSYDFTIAFDIDGTSTEKVTTSDFQYAPTSIDKFKKVEYTNLDGGEHTITIVYRKDGSGNDYDDKGYLIIPKEQ